MLRIELIEGEPCPVFICDQCHERIKEDIEGIYQWQTRQAQVVSGDIVFLHRHCTYDYEEAHQTPDLEWDWKAITEFTQALHGSLEIRKPLDDLRVKLCDQTDQWKIYHHKTDVEEHLLYVRIRREVIEPNRAELNYRPPKGGGLSTRVKLA